MHATLRKQEILRGKKRFARVFGGGTKITSAPVVCFVRACDQRSCPDHPRVKNGRCTRVAFVVRRTVRRAVDRNRIKRLLREAYRRNKDLLILPRQEPQRFRDMIFLCSPDASESGLKLTFAQVDSCMKKILVSVRKGP